MNTVITRHRSQIAFRFDDSLIARIKRTAKANGLTLNDFARLLFERVTLLDTQILPKDFRVSNELEALTGFIEGFTDQQLIEDPKLAHLLSK